VTRTFLIQASRSQSLPHCARISGSWHSISNEAAKFSGEARACQQECRNEPVPQPDPQPGGRKKIAHRFIGRWCGRINRVPPGTAQNCFPRPKRSAISSPSSEHYLYALFRQLLDALRICDQRASPLIEPRGADLVCGRWLSRGASFRPAGPCLATMIMGAVNARGEARIPLRCAAQNRSISKLAQWLTRALPGQSR
jgi:hypothetical protein